MTSYFSFSFYALNMDDSLKVKKALFMFVDLFGTERFDYDTLVRFIITIRKNYRQVWFNIKGHLPLAVVCATFGYYRWPTTTGRMGFMWPTVFTAFSSLLLECLGH